MRILGIETSCDETSIAVVEDGKIIKSNIISSQIEIHKEFGGVVPEIASRHHIKNIMAVLKESLDEAEMTLNDMDYIAVTYAPGLIGALLTGIAVAKGLSFGSGKPLIPVHHIKGHIYSNFMEHDVVLPAIALVVSGGHTNIVYIDEEHNFTTLGGTLDDAAGEAFDKVARVIDVGYPGGPIIDKMYYEGNPNAIKMPKSVLDGKYDFSFSGVKTFVINYINKAQMKGEEVNRYDLAASFQKNIVETLVEKTILAAKEKSVTNIVLAGGVAANSLLRKMMTEEGERNNIKVYYPSMKLCTDNGAMIAGAAYFGLVSGKKKPAASDLNGFANMTLEED